MRRTLVVRLESPLYVHCTLTCTSREAFDTAIQAPFVMLQLLNPKDKVLVVWMLCPNGPLRKDKRHLTVFKQVSEINYNLFV
ncbi:hypothetical protein Hanom_Chr09g00855051 [Helianthus anomalus]